VSPARRAAAAAFLYCSSAYSGYCLRITRAARKDDPASLQSLAAGDVSLVPVMSLHDDRCGVSDVAATGVCLLGTDFGGAASCLAVAGLAVAAGCSDEVGFDGVARAPTRVEIPVP
jgi:hypothetical protein